VPTRAETAYPRLKNYVTSRELTEIYTPTQEELTLANQYTKKGATKLGFLVKLKTFQRLGYFVDSNIVPSAIVSQIIKCTQLSVLPSCLTSYEQSKTRKRHIALIREFQSVTSYGAKEIEKALGESPDQLLTECEAHLAYTGNNYYPFLWRFYRSHRAILFQILKQVKLRSTTQDKSWEAVYILDGLLKNTSDIQPDTIHADTQGQSTPVFALAYLLGIKLMPRIRNWQDLTLCRPDKQVRYDHIDDLFTDVIDWKLIETHLTDMLRVILSIKAGKFTASTILRKLGTYSRKNRLYQAFSELGRAIRTGFLMEYLGSQELRQTIQGALNKSEAFNGFTKWVGFGNAGMIQQNSREEQRKIIKYNHLVSNCLIFYNVFEISRILQEYIQAGNTIEEEIIGALSPYLTRHINRFGSYSLDLNRKPPTLDFGFSLIPSS
jgi:TnpA family transposase